MRTAVNPPLKRPQPRFEAFSRASRRLAYLSLALLLAALRIAHSEILFDTRYQYDALGQPTVITDGAGHSQRNAWDALGRLQSQTNPLNHSTTYRYQANDALNRVQAPNGAITTWTVDGFGQAADETSPDRGLTRYQYDAVGNLTQQIDARGAQIDTAYDALNRPIERRIYRPDHTLEATHRYTWDRAPHGIGRLAEIDVGPNRIAFDYDLAGHIVTRAYTRGAVTLAIHSAYHPTTGQRDTLTYPSGSVIQYHYNAAGQITDLTWNGQILADQLQYTAFGALSALRLANGLTHQRTYDTAGRLTSYTLANDVYQLTYDAAGQLITLTPPDPNGQQHFSYDAAGQLTDYQGLAHSETYRYDPNGNRQERTQDSQNTLYQYLANSNRLQSINATALTHDAAGNLTLDLARQYTYDSRGRLSQLTQGPTLVRYEYNGLGERVLKQLGTDLRHFVYDDNGRLLGEYDATGQPLAEYAWLGDLPLAYRVYRTVNGLTQIDLYAIETDQLGTPRLLTDPAQQPRWRWQSAPFGDSPPDENPANLGPLTFNLRFPGQYADQESNLHYNYFRDYDPQTGRYVQSDPIGLRGGINTYAYVESDPINRIDLFGLYQMCHRNLLIPIPYARHCYAKFADGTTSSYDPSGVGPDPDPTQKGTICTDPEEPKKDQCVKRNMKKCKAENYDFVKFNCCHCVEQAMKACGIYFRSSTWPNWPMNPGPQPGEPGFNPRPIYNDSLGK